MIFFSNKGQIKDKTHFRVKIFKKEKPLESSDSNGFRVVAGSGFEPLTFGLWAQRATRLLHPAIFYYVVKMVPETGIEPVREVNPTGF